MNVSENYIPVRMTASGVVFSIAGNLGGFMCTATGTLQISENNAGAAGASIVDAFAVTAGMYYPLPFAMGKGCYATLTGGAQGTFGYNS